jgi:hypothetical protein
LSWYAAPSILAALRQATVLWPNRNKGADGTIGDASHSASTSDHNPAPNGCVHAFDLTHDPAHGVDTFKLADHLRDRANADPDFRGVIKYVISNRRIYNPSISPAWRYYGGSSPHTDHVHVSINYTTHAENWSGQWWSTQQEDEVTDDDLKKIGALIDGKLDALEKRIPEIVRREAADAINGKYDPSDAKNYAQMVNAAREIRGTDASGAKIKPSLRELIEGQ